MRKKARYDLLQDILTKSQNMTSWIGTLNIKAENNDDSLDKRMSKCDKEFEHEPKWWTNSRILEWKQPSYRYGNIPS